MILDHEEENPDKFKDKTYESTVPDVPFDEENSVQYTQAYYKEALLPKVILVSGYFHVVLRKFLLAYEEEVDVSSIMFFLEYKYQRTRSCCCPCRTSGNLMRYDPLSSFML